MLKTLFPSYKHLTLLQYLLDKNIVYYKLVLYDYYTMEMTW